MFTLSLTAFLIPNKSKIKGFGLVSKIWGFTHDYVSLSNSLNQEIYYSYWPCKFVKENPPLIILNTGGPGVSAQTEFFVANGPLSGNRLDHIFSKDPWHSLAEIGDLLYPDQPAGTGFSLTDSNNISIEKMIRNTQNFFDRLAIDHPEILNKKRQVILFGVSYGVAQFANIAKYLKENGYNVKVYFDSPWVDPVSSAQLFPTIMKKYGVIQDSDLFSKWESNAKKCEEKVLGDPKNFTLKDGLGCDELYNGNSPYTDKNGNQYVNGYHLKPSKSFIYFYEFEKKIGDLIFNTAIIKWLFGGKKKTVAWNQEVYQQFQVLNYNYRGFTDDFYKLLDMGVRVSMVNGFYDGITNPLITKTWQMSYEPYFEKKWDGILWTDTKYGKIKEWKKFDYELVDDAFHFVGQTVKNISYEKIKRLVETD